MLSDTRLSLVCDKASSTFQGPQEVTYRQVPATHARGHIGKYVRFKRQPVTCKDWKDIKPLVEVVITTAFAPCTRRQSCGCPPPPPPPWPLQKPPDQLPCLHLLQCSPRALGNVRSWLHSPCSVSPFLPSCLELHPAATSPSGSPQHLLVPVCHGCDVLTHLLTLCSRPTLSEHHGAGVWFLTALSPGTMAVPSTE